MDRYLVENNKTSDDQVGTSYWRVIAIEFSDKLISLKIRKISAMHPKNILKKFYGLETLSTMIFALYEKIVERLINNLCIQN